MKDKDNDNVINSLFNNNFISDKEINNTKHPKNI